MWTRLKSDKVIAEAGDFSSVIRSGTKQGWLIVTKKRVVAIAKCQQGNQYTCQIDRLIVYVTDNVISNTKKKRDTTFKFARHVSDTQYPSSVEGCLQISDFI